MGIWIPKGGLGCGLCGILLFWVYSRERLGNALIGILGVRYSPGKNRRGE